MTATGSMINRPLLVSSILTHAVRNNPDQEIVTATEGNGKHRYTYADFYDRVVQLAAGLQNNNINAGERVGTLAWNTYRHLEIYYATAGTGLICHTINPRLHISQIQFIINDAQDIVIF